METFKKTVSINSFDLIQSKKISHPLSLLYKYRKVESIDSNHLKF